ncbi:serine/arginine repetitive matrix protein 2-like [Homarus americanus]|uniref:serine/arginine repetitive matrix protein 2-like n=1 Tax=Homarus americanus TaxID=6706 RepID=UPI001C44022A|nr:serine/arginine repetitive matrix protein 2-like [Homarus americanus]
MESSTSKPLRERQGNGVIIGGGVSPASDEAGEGESVGAYVGGNEQGDNRGRGKEVSPDKSGVGKNQDVREERKHPGHEATSTRSQDKRIDGENHRREKTGERKHRREKRRKYGLRGRQRTHSGRRRPRQQRLSAQRRKGSRLRGIEASQEVKSSQTPQDVNKAADPRVAAMYKRPDATTRPRRVYRRGRGRSGVPVAGVDSGTINRKKNKHYSPNPSGGATLSQTDNKGRETSSGRRVRKNRSRAITRKDAKLEGKKTLQIQWRVRGEGGPSLKLPSSDVTTTRHHHHSPQNRDKNFARNSDHPGQTKTRPSIRRQRHHRRPRRRRKKTQRWRARAASRRVQRRGSYGRHWFTGSTEDSYSTRRRKHDRRNRRELAAPFIVPGGWRVAPHTESMVERQPESPGQKRRSLKVRRDFKRLSGSTPKDPHVNTRSRSTDAEVNLRSQPTDADDNLRSRQRRTDVNPRSKHILTQRRKRETRPESRDKSRRRSGDSGGWRDVSNSSRERKGDLRCKKRQVSALTQRRRGTGRKLRASGGQGVNCYRTKSLSWKAELTSSSCDYSGRNGNQSLLIEEDSPSSRIRPTLQENHHQENHHQENHHQENQTPDVPYTETGEGRSEQRTRRELRNLFDAPNITYRCSPTKKYWLFASSVPMGIYPVRVKVLQGGSIIRLSPIPGETDGGRSGEGVDLTSQSPPTTTHHRSDIPPEEEYTELDDVLRGMSPTSGRPSPSTSPSPPSSASPSSPPPHSPPPTPTPPRPPHTPPVRITNQWMEETLAKVKTVVDSILRSIGSARDEVERKRDERRGSPVTQREGGEGEESPQEKHNRGGDERRGRRIIGRKGKRRKPGETERRSEVYERENENDENTQTPENITQGERTGGVEVRDAEDSSRREHFSASSRNVTKLISDTVSVSEDSSVPISGSDSVSKSGSDSVSKSGSDSVSKSGSDSVSKSESDSTSKSESDSVSKSESDSSSKSESDSTSKSKSESVSIPSSDSSDSTSKSSGGEVVLSSTEKEGLSRHDNTSGSSSSSEVVPSSESDTLLGSDGETVPSVDGGIGTTYDGDMGHSVNATETNQHTNYTQGFDLSHHGNKSGVAGTSGDNRTSPAATSSKQTISSVTDLLFTVPNERVIKPAENSQVQSEIKSTEKLIRTSLEDLLFRVPSGSSRQTPEGVVDPGTTGDVRGITADVPPASPPSGAPQLHELSSPNASVATTLTDANGHSNDTLTETTSQHEPTDSRNARTPRTEAINVSVPPVKSDLENVAPGHTTENESAEEGRGGGGGDLLTSEHMLRTTCLPVGSIGRFKVEDVTYLVTGMGAGTGAEDCWREVTSVVKKHIKLSPLNHTTLLATTAFYFVAASANLIEPDMAYGFVKVGQFRVAATLMCEREPRMLPDPLACLDYQYVAALLTHGLNLSDDTEILVCEKIQGFRLGWALGAALDYLQNH